MVIQLGLRVTTKCDCLFVELQVTVQWTLEPDNASSVSLGLCGGHHLDDDGA